MTFKCDTVSSMPPFRSLFTQPKFLFVSLLGSLIVGVTSVLASLSTQIAILGVLLSILLGLLLTWLEAQAGRDANRAELSILDRVVEALEDEPELAMPFCCLVNTRSRSSRRSPLNGCITLLHRDCF